MIVSKMSQHFRLSKRGSKTGLVIIAPAKYAANFLYNVYFFVNSWFEISIFMITIVNTNFEYGFNQDQIKIYGKETDISRLLPRTVYLLVQMQGSKCFNYIQNFKNRTDDYDRCLDKSFFFPYMLMVALK